MEANPERVKCCICGQIMKRVYDDWGFEYFCQNSKCETYIGGD